MKFSAALCTYNGEAYIREQLASIINQTLSIDELVICDDCSTDNTINEIEKLLIGVKFRVKLLRNEQNIGAIRSFEKCIQQCAGDIILFSDQDDSWLPEKVALLAGVFAADTQALAVFSDAVLIDGTGGELPGSLWTRWGFTRERQAQWLDNDLAFADLLANRNAITGATLAFRKELLSFLIPFELPAVYWHDAWVGLVAAARGGLRFLPASTIRYRIHSQQQVGTLSGASDRKFASVSPEYFLKKVARLFPEKRSIVFRDRPSLLRKIANKLLYTTQGR